ncbi:hypothetical protein DSECCO2_646620 [anaerobic digester metagenome]
MAIIDEMFQSGVILFLVALIGFIAHDQFTRGLYRGIPPSYSHSLEALLHYIAKAVISAIFILAFGFIPISYIFFWLVDSFTELGLLEQSLIEQAVPYFVGTFLLAMILFTTLQVIQLLAVFSQLTNNLWVRVKLKENKKYRKFAKIICETEQFIYFERADNRHFWVAIKKEDISVIEPFYHRPRISEFLSGKMTNLKLKLKFDRIEISDPTGPIIVEQTRHEDNQLPEKSPD